MAERIFIFALMTELWDHYRYRSIGWQGLPNDKNGNPHLLIVKFKNNLYQRMLARNTPCGSYPDKQTPFGTLPDGKPFWDDDGDKYQSSSNTYPDPPKWQTVFVNAEKVPEPINPCELAEFDQTRVGKEHGSKQQDGGGKWSLKLERNMTIHMITMSIYIQTKMS